jgi:putative SOS response-associated peptidase YedK
MCGRYTLKMTAAEAETFYGFPEIQQRRIEPTLPGFNIAPSQAVLIILDDAGKPVLTTARWGFAPRWWKSKSPPPINARAETIAERPTFRGAIKSNRCLLPADGFYEWQARPGQRKKQPMHIRLPSGRPFTFAGIYTAADDGELTCAIVTTAANEKLRGVHERMPVLLAEQELQALWLDPTVTDVGALEPCLASPASDELEIFPVSDLVNSTRNEGPALVQPAD